MNKNVAIVTDSTAYLPKEIRERLAIHMVPLSVVFGEESYQEEIDISTEQFYDKMLTAEKLPTTSQPATGQFVELFTKLSEAGYKQIITIHLSSKISGTYQSAISAGEMVEGVDVYGFDTEITCSPQGFFIQEAAKMALEGVGVDDIFARLEEMKTSLKAYFMVDDLHHLHRGGRLSGGQLVIGNLLKIKPILHVEKGSIVPFEKVRTEKKALARILSLLEKDVQHGGAFLVTVIHAKKLDVAEQLAATIRERFSNVNVDVSYFGPVIGTHLGAGSLAVSWYKQSN